MGGFSGPLLFGHRGAPACERENTLASFDRALADGANALETDAHLSRDGRVVLVHDPELSRVFGRDARVGELDCEALEALGVPSLRTVVARYPQVPLNIDIKQRDPPMERAIVDDIAQAHAAERVLLTSFFDDVVGRVRGCGYTGPTGLAYREVARLYALPQLLSRVWPLRGQRAQVPVRSGRAHFGTRGFIRKCHALGVAVDFWVINDVEEGRHLLQLGADGLMSDNPALLRTLFGH